MSQRSSNRQTIFVADAHRGDSQRSVAHANDKLTAFLELEAVIRQRVKDWEIIADNPSKAGWRWGWISAMGERSGLLTHTATTESALSSVAKKS